MEVQSFETILYFTNLISQPCCAAVIFVKWNNFRIQISNNLNKNFLPQLQANETKKYETCLVDVIFRIFSITYAFTLIRWIPYFWSCNVLLKFYESSLQGIALPEHLTIKGCNVK